MPLFRRMLVALSGLPSDESLLRYAALLARLVPALEVRGVHVIDPDGDPAQPVMRDRVREACAGHLPSAPCEIVTGDVLDSILEVTSVRACDLILIGHRQDARRRRSLARRLSMKSPCSVWMVPDDCPSVISRILVPIDFSPRSADSLGLATALAEAAGLDECLALHVYFNQASTTFDEFDEMLLEDAGAAFALFIAPIDLHGVDARPVLIESPNVAQAILRTAAEQGSDLIVMGTRGRSRSAAVLLGSETEQALIHSRVPLLAVKHFGARMRLLQALRDDRVRRRATDDWYI